MDTSNDLTEVPPGHEVKIYTPTIYPGVITSSSGAFLANLGTSSDEYLAELQSIAEEVHRLISRIASNGGTKRLPIIMPAEECRLSDLFAPNDVKVTPYPSLLLWVLDAASAHLWLRNPDPLVDAIKQAGVFRFNNAPLTQYVLINIVLWGISADGSADSKALPPPGLLDLARILTESGIKVSAIPQNKKYFIEVIRPDCTLSMFMTDMLPDVCASRETVTTVDRSPHLQRLILAAIEDPGDRTRLALFKELLTRDLPLVIVTDREGKADFMSWPEVGEALPVYPDISSAYYSAEDLQLPMDSFAVAYLTSRDLFLWAEQENMGGLAINAYKDRANPRYLYVSRDRVSALARLFRSGTRD